MLNTLPQLLAQHDPQTSAIGAPGRADMTRAELLCMVKIVGGALRDHGFGQQDVVAIVMANGPEMAVVFLGVGCFAIAAPLNSAYREDEFDFYLGDLNAKARLLIDAKTPSLLLPRRGNSIPLHRARNARGPLLLLRMFQLGGVGSFSEKSKLRIQLKARANSRRNPISQIPENGPNRSGVQVSCWG